MNQMKNENSRAALTAAIHEYLFPALENRGFSFRGEEKIAAKRAGPKALLFHFRKESSPASSVLAVCVKSFARPTFQIIAGHVPSEGVKMWCPEEIIPAERVTAEILQEQAFLQSAPTNGYAPFKQPIWAHLIGSEAGINKITQRAAESLPHLIAWLERGTSSPYVRIVKFARPSPSSSE